jgi:hypothetical protein
MLHASLLTSFALLLAVVNGAPQDPENVGSKGYGFTMTTQFDKTAKPTLMSAPLTSSYPASNPYNLSISPETSRSTEYTYIYTYPSPLEYISKISITKCDTNTTTFTSYNHSPTPYNSSDAVLTTSTSTGPGNPFHVSPIATATSSGVVCTTSYSNSYYFKGFLSVSCMDRTEDCCKDFGMNCPGEMV